jgi:uncharacterized HAD superfamily protein
MTKPIIAVDIDDVLAVHAEAMVAYSNRTFGTALTLDDYTEHWSLMWQVDHEETARRAHEYHLTDDMTHYRHHEDALEVLRYLAQDYRLIIVTARRKQVTELTQTWIEKHFKGVFEAIYYAGIWDTVSADSPTATKAELCQKLGVSYLIDDQSKHCNAVQEKGIQAIMFGDYPWNSRDTVHPYVVKCATWQEVESFFEARHGR